MQRFYINTHGPYGASIFSVLANDEAEANDFAARISKDKIIKVRPENRWDRMGYGTGRFVIRTLRVGFGAAIALGAWLLFSSENISDTPFSQLTLGMLAGAIARGVFGFALIFGAWHLAFGEGPERDKKPPPKPFSY